MLHLYYYYYYYYDYYISYQMNLYNLALRIDNYDNHMTFVGHIASFTPPALEMNYM